MLNQLQNDRSHTKEIVVKFVKEFRLISFNYTASLQSNIKIIKISKYINKGLPYLNNQPVLYIPFYYERYSIKFI